MLGILERASRGGDIHDVGFVRQKRDDLFGEAGGADDIHLESLSQFFWIKAGFFVIQQDPGVIDENVDLFVQSRYAGNAVSNGFRICEVELEDIEASGGFVGDVVRGSADDAPVLGDKFGGEGLADAAGSAGDEHCFHDHILAEK